MTEPIPIIDKQTKRLLNVAKGCGYQSERARVDQQGRITLEFANAQDVAQVEQRADEWDRALGIWHNKRAPAECGNTRPALATETLTGGGDDPA